MKGFAISKKCEITKSLLLYKTTNVVQIAINGPMVPTKAMNNPSLIFDLWLVMRINENTAVTDKIK